MTIDVKELSNRSLLIHYCGSKSLAVSFDCYADYTTNTKDKVDMVKKLRENAELLLAEILRRMEGYDQKE